MPSLVAGPEIIVNQTAHNALYTTAGVQLANGNYLTLYYGANIVPNTGGTITWLEGDIYGRIYDSTGNPVGGEFSVNAATSDDQFGGKAVALPDGGFVVVYVSSTIPDQIHENDTGEVTNTGTTYVQRFDATGHQVGSAVAVGNSDVLTLPFIAPTANGGYNAYWFTQQPVTFAPETNVQAFDANGNAIGSSAKLMLGNYPETITNIGGTIYATYYAGDVRLISLGVDGKTPAGTSTLVNTYTTSAQVNSNVAVLSDGTFIIAWQSNGQDGGNYGVYAQHFAANGTKIGGEFRANTYTTLSQSSPKVAALADGGFVIVWVSNGQDGNLQGVFGQQYDAAGATVGAEFQVNVTTTGAQYIPYVSAFDGGGFAVYWQGPDGTGATQLYERTWTLPGMTVDGDGLANRLSGGSGGDTMHGLGGNDTLTAYGGNDVLDGGTGDDRMFGGAGNDLYIFDSTGDRAYEATTGGLDTGGIDTVQSSVSATLSVFIENLTLTGTANINATGNDDDNILTGNSGNNVLDGKGGADYMFGGAGNDTYVVDNANDRVSEETVTGTDDGGTDRVQASIDYTLGNFIENLTLTGTDNLNGTGNSLNNTIYGNAGDNVLDGAAGADRMAGYGGNDTYIVDNTGDVVLESADSGDDTVQSSVSFTLGANVEDLELTGSANINGTGNASVNTLTGNDGNNVLDGKGGADIMVGGKGDDTYYFDNADDWALGETADGGNDRVYSSVSHAISDYIETLILTGTANIDGTGSAQDNAITGNAGNNRLDGMGGVDILKGGAGNDTYVVDNAGDLTVEVANAGTDTVESTISWTLGGNIENLVLTQSADINGTGNTLANSLTGNAGDNLLDGKAGADTMAGGLGDDTYVVDNAGDVVIEGDGGSEGGGEGTDTVQAGLSYTLGANVENLLLTGAAAINGTGNTGNNWITGNTAINTLIGGDGNDHLAGMRGNDTLTGGNGADVFVFAHFGADNGIDHLTDFASGVDALQFNAADFGFSAGYHLQASDLTVGVKAVGPQAQFLYNPATHTLYWDSNGNLGGQATAIAVFDNGASPAVTDFIFV